MSNQHTNKQRAIFLLRDDGFSTTEINNLLNEPKSLLDEFAGQAMNGLLSNTNHIMSYKQIVIKSYDVANMMMKERKLVKYEN